jgi:hypothetical protein
LLNISAFFSYRDDGGLKSPAEPAEKFLFLAPFPQEVSDRHPDEDGPEYQQYQLESFQHG